MSQPTATRISPFCAALRSKKFYFLERPPQVPADLLDASNHCWCLHTMQALGPDGEQADPQGCTAGRACFEAWGRERPPADMA